MTTFDESPQYQSAYDQAAHDVAAAMDNGDVSLAWIDQHDRAGTLENAISDWGSGDERRDHYLHAVASILRGHLRR